MPRIVLVLLGLLVSLAARSQQLKLIANQEFSSRNGEWYKKVREGKYHKVDTEILTIKFKTDGVEDFLSKQGLHIPTDKGRSGIVSQESVLSRDFKNIVVEIFRRRTHRQDYRVHRR